MKYYITYSIECGSTPYSPFNFHDEEDKQKAFDECVFQGTRQRARWYCCEVIEDINGRHSKEIFCFTGDRIKG